MMYVINTIFHVERNLKNKNKGQNNKGTNKYSKTHMFRSLFNYKTKTCMSNMNSYSKYSRPSATNGFLVLNTAPTVKL